MASNTWKSPSITAGEKVFLASRSSILTTAMPGSGRVSCTTLFIPLSGGSLPGKFLMQQEIPNVLPHSRRAGQAVDLLHRRPFHFRGHDPHFLKIAFQVPHGGGFQA